MHKTAFLSVTDVRRLLARTGVRSFLALLADRIQSDFLRWGEFQKSARMANYFPEGVIELMPTSDGKLYSFKYINGHPKNVAHGLPTVMGFGCLSDVATGSPRLLAEMTILTGLRTAATSAVAARALMNKGAKKMAMIGAGAQSEFQILACHELLGVDSFPIYDPDSDAVAKVVRNLEAYKSIEVAPKTSVESAIEGCALITTCTARRGHHAVLTAKMVAPGTHINGIGGDCPGKTELEAALIAKSRVVVEYEPQARIEGEIQQMSRDFAVMELWTILAGHEQGRRSQSEITLFDSVGFSIEDFSTLCLVHELAAEHGIGQDLELIPEIQDPKDLFGLLN